jgi:predicted PhzF superfamily epimerase YddE/YHI9
MKNNDKFDYCKTYKVEQGYFMNSPSNIYMKAEKESDRIFVGGYVKIESIEEINV